MNATQTAEMLAATVGAKQFWTIQREVDAAYIVGDHAAQCAGYGRGRFMVTDGKAIELARKAGVQCDDDGRIG